jgi:cyclopropane-fatty-acyl-phospholipid synthase
MPARSQVAPVVAMFAGREGAVGIVAYDGSTAGPANPLSRIVVRDPRALRCIATAPGDLGLARAYVWGYLEVEGDLFETLHAVARHDEIGSLTWRDRAEVLRRLGPWILVPTAPPPEEARPSVWWGLRHSLVRDSKAISHHYDVSNRFYRWLLGPTMAYTCAVYPREDASLDEAQE